MSILPPRNLLDLTGNDEDTIVYEYQPTKQRRSIDVTPPTILPTLPGESVSEDLTELNIIDKNREITVIGDGLDVIQTTPPAETSEMKPFYQSIVTSPVLLISAVVLVWYLLKGKRGRKKGLSGVTGLGWVPVVVAALGVIGTIGGGAFAYKTAAQQRQATETAAQAAITQQRIAAQQTEAERESQKQKLILYAVLGGAAILLLAKRGKK